MCSLSPTRTRWLPLTLLFAAITVGHSARALPLAPRSFYGGTTEDKVTGEGPLSLREAVMMASAVGGRSLILLRPGTYTLTISAYSKDASGYSQLSPEETEDSAVGDLDVTSGSVTLVGAGADRTVVQCPDPTRDVITGRIFYVGAGAQLSLRGLTLRAGEAEADGGAIRNEGSLSLDRCVIRDCIAYGSGGGISNAGQMRLTRTTLQNNQAVSQDGGGIDDAGAATLESCTLAGNSAGSSGNGGGMNVEAGGSVTLVNCTVDGNQLQIGFNHGGGIACAAGAQVSLLHCTVTRNTGDGTGIYSAGSTQIADTVVAGSREDPLEPLLGPDLSGSFTSLGGNVIEAVKPEATGLGPRDLVGTDPEAGPLQDNGGPVPTCALPAASPARHAARTAVPTDARGVSRPGTPGLPTDSGAYEVSDQPVLTLSGGVLAVTPEGSSVMAEPTATLVVPDDVTLYGGSVQISAAGPGAALVQLGIAPTGGVTLAPDGTLRYTGAPIGTVRNLTPQMIAVDLGGYITPTAAQALLRAITISLSAVLVSPAPVSFTWNVTDGLNDATGPVTRTVLLMPPPATAAGPVVGNTAYAAFRGTPLPVPAPGVLGAVGGSSNRVRATLVDPPQGGMLAFAADGSFIYRPLVGFSGTDHFTYRATNGAGLGSLGTATIRVSNAPPRSTPRLRLAGTADFQIPDPYRSPSSNRLTLNVLTSPDGLTRGTFLLWDSSTHRQIISSRVTAVVQSGSQVRVYATALEAYVSGHVNCVIDLDLSAGAAAGIRVETDGRTQLGPVPIRSSTLALQHR